MLKRVGVLDLDWNWWEGIDIIEREIETGNVVQAHGVGRVTLVKLRKAEGIEVVLVPMTFEEFWQNVVLDEE